MREKSVVIVMDEDIYDKQSKEIFELRKTSIQVHDGNFFGKQYLFSENKRLEKENSELLDELARCRELLLPLLEDCRDYEELLVASVGDPMTISDLCERVKDEYED
ncbi:hypothetical protein [Bacillus wiedmannii]|uniref:hypothetical protein n=1 Tax=Bacillus wiedmannii TaxID=1890302 RepID=UPI0007E15B8C|nr:hypothetical protein [Bacillus wiedmannii]OAK35891.1 hypothetical protein A6284_26550 [Bacillus wiedmannii]